MALLLRALIFIALIILIYAVVKYILNPKRKLELAHEKKNFYFLDEPKNVRRNFLITYKGVMFEGEKYLGTTENAFDITFVSIWVKNKDRLQGLQLQDFNFLEKEIRQHYPHAELDWKSPIKEFIRQAEQDQK
ncbi:sigma-w pathway protein ysdB [Salibacterium salarium]|uniref:Sigma-w pathway protein ysdB n=1 Tax=Salibacterium salarium TaxID=284579 RepID=A0A3R9QK74_9BACI|nr:sigma-w pathway protein ysdB [Salibacterium salarium]RSL32206.1 sigma-w pathway protein ysdB [Salibacterium salarium]